MLLENNYKPKNESDVHYELKQIGKYILKNKGCKIIGTEVDIGNGNYLDEYNQFNKHKHTKSIIDVVGLEVKGSFYSSKKCNVFKEPTFRVYGIEAKASLSDYKNGFNSLCEKTWIIAPVGVIPVELLPKNIGLYEVNLDSGYTINSDFSKMTGVIETVKARINLDPSFYMRDKPKENREFQWWAKKVLQEIGNRFTNDMLYKKNEIKINGL